MVQVAHFFTTLSFLLATSSIANALGVDASICPGAEICINPSIKVGSRAAAALPLSPDPNEPTRRTTNAQRFARGLPPLKPKRRYTGSRVARAIPSGVPTTNYRGLIQVRNSADNSLLGYISKNLLNGAQMAYDADISQGLIVDFTVAQGSSPTDEIEIATENQSSGFSLLSLIQGRDDVDSVIMPASFQYLYIGGSAHTDPGATPQTVSNSYTQATGLSRTAETSLWIFDPTSMGLSPQWVNPDGSKPTTLNFAQSTALYAGGDTAAFNARYPAPLINTYYVFSPL